MQVVPYGDGGGPDVLLGADQGLAQAVHLLRMLLRLGGEADHLVHLVHGALHLAHALICPVQLQESE